MRNVRGGEESSGDQGLQRAIGIEVTHKQAYMMATLIQELRNEGQCWTYAEAWTRWTARHLTGTE